MNPSDFIILFLGTVENLLVCRLPKAARMQDVFFWPTSDTNGVIGCCENLVPGHVLEQCIRRWL